MTSLWVLGVSSARSLRSVLILCPRPLNLHIAYGVAMSILINHSINVNEDHFDININNFTNHKNAVLIRVSLGISLGLLATILLISMML